MCTNQQHSQTLSFSVESKLFPKFILETSLSGSPENFRITLTAKPGLNDNINLNLSKSCPVELDHLIGTIEVFAILSSGYSLYIHFRRPVIPNTSYFCSPDNTVVQQTLPAVVILKIST